MSKHPTNPEAVKVKRDGPRGWHWVARFDAAVHTLFEGNPFDHDGDGKPGGSLKGEKSTVARGRRKKEAGQ